MHDHIKIGHRPLLVLPAGSDEYAGAYWTGSTMVIITDLGSDHEEAISEFRESLRERGQH